MTKETAGPVDVSTIESTRRQLPKPEKRPANEPESTEQDGRAVDQRRSNATPTGVATTVRSTLRRDDRSRAGASTVGQTSVKVRVVSIGKETRRSCAVLRTAQNAAVSAEARRSDYAGRSLAARLMAVAVANSGPRHVIDRHFGDAAHRHIGAGPDRWDGYVKRI